MLIKNKFNIFLKKILNPNIIQNILWEYNSLENKIIFYFPHEYLKEYIKINFLNNIKKYLNEEFKIQVIELKVTNKFNINNSEIKINKKYNFDNFFYGENNHILIKTIRNIIKKNIKDYNPIVLYGDKGCGKSHLLMASFNLYKTLYSNKNIFLFDLKKLNKKIYFLKDIIREFDIFMIDHFEEIKDSKTNQEYFLYLIDNIYNKNKIMFITIEKEYLKYGDLDNHLKSKILGGLVLKINNPDLKTKSKFIDKYIQKYNIDINDSQKMEILLNFKNIHDIKKLLLNLIAEKQFNNNINITKKIKTNINKTKITPNHIIETVAKHFKISPQKLISKTNKKEISLARQIAIFLIKDILGLSSTQLGEIFNRDHSTILYSIKKINNYSKLDINFYNLLIQLKKKSQF